MKILGRRKNNVNAKHVKFTILRQCYSTVNFYLNNKIISFMCLKNVHNKREQFIKKRQS